MKKETSKLSIAIGGLDPTGGAGIIQDSKVMSELGILCFSVATCITFQNLNGVFGLKELDFKSIKKQIDLVLKNHKVEYGKVGALGGKDGAKALIKTIEQYRIKFVVDPVIKSKNGFPLITRDGFEILMKKILPLSFFITPNINEAEEITGIKITDKKDIITAGKNLSKINNSFVAIKGGHLKGENIEDFLFFKGELVKSFRKKRSRKILVHGTGCIFSSSLTAFLVSGYSPEKAFTLASSFTSKAIALSQKIKGGKFRVYL
jgi:hydroxymethylpyrimidine/phosphomethylpyrimidine kinase